MRLPFALVFLAILSGCASAPRPAADNQTAPNFIAPPRGSLIVLIPPPQSKGLETGENQMGAQLKAQLKAVGYDVATLQRANFEKLWPAAAESVGGIFDSVSGAPRPLAYQQAMSLLAQHVCEELKCSLLIQQRLVARRAELVLKYAEWDGVRQALHFSSYADANFKGTVNAISVELIALTDKGEFAFRRLGGATLPSEFNTTDTKWELRKDLFSDDAEMAEGVRVALEPLAKAPPTR
jgi:hypothetical protein